MHKTIKIISVLFAAMLCLAGVPFGAAQHLPSTVDGDWHQFQKDSSNTGITSDAAPRSDPELVWSRFTHTSIWSGGINVPPIIVGDLVYIYDVNGTLHAFNMTDGTLIWRNETSVGFQSSTLLR